MGNKVILFPFCIIIFIQLFILEILYFSPRFPLKIFFGPVISTLWAEHYLHYPHSLALLPKLYQYAQVPVFIFINSFLLALAVAFIIQINSGKRIHAAHIIKEISSFYIHIIIPSFLLFIIMTIFIKWYATIRSQAETMVVSTGLSHILKTILVDGSSYINFLISVLMSTVFAYVLPIIVFEKKKSPAAIMANFKMLRGSFWLTFVLILIPSLFFLPVMMLRDAVATNLVFPEIRLVVLVISIFVTVAIDAIVYTALTTYYLFKKEGR